MSKMRSALSISYIIRTHFEHSYFYSIFLFVVFDSVLFSLKIMFNLLGFA